LQLSANVASSTRADAALGLDVYTIFSLSLISQLRTCRLSLVALSEFLVRKVGDCERKLWAGLHYVGGGGMTMRGRGDLLIRWSHRPPRYVFKCLAF
jgi:hypothetical protein